MEPLGHFAIEPDMDQKILQARGAFLGGASNSVPGGSGASPSSVLSSSSASSFHTLSELSSDVKKVLGSGGSGIAVNQQMKWPAGGHVAAFSGKGHTLSGDSTDEPDPEPAHTTTGTGSPRHKPMDVDNDEDAALFNPDSKPDTMDIDVQVPDPNKPSTSQAGDGPSAQDRDLFERVGPGYTRLNPTKTNETYMQSEMFQTIASSIQAALNEDPEVKVKFTYNLILHFKVTS